MTFKVINFLPNMRIIESKIFVFESIMAAITAFFVFFVSKQRVYEKKKNRGH